MNTDLKCPVCQEKYSINTNIPMNLHTHIKGEPQKKHQVICSNCLDFYKIKSLSHIEIISSYEPDQETIDKIKRQSNSEENSGTNSKCNFAVNGITPVKQVYYQCLTCTQSKGLPICESCAKTCHKGHLLVVLQNGFLTGCACGQNMLHRPCKCLIDESSLPCTNLISKERQVQHGYACFTCGLDFVCNSCAQICHRGHYLKEIEFSENVCKCGLNRGITTCKCNRCSIKIPNDTTTPTLPENLEN
ncbi:hypothetical protein TVAG_370580 [Trichomonas vaginalis G3]|uniref:UBR-type domain-containing protein n=1 Tax=Trichomonas vaginalis (strain ATCC PRA-98 / G3) TaxID=412133 RepID=A2FJQ5_TRIV3|nr:perineurial glial growth protein family [Trichomonas vaginalis G3]EAX94887.1 hypothetical protein TVAG_370580 [Trichomonas vaginalis G3]KAI5541489.1 perineurial glial growth protein family [Trichomonas vaginalis G3]|eukprot:XP_001307817.1 hypothetical protein [Trichomonas vaginalis G3]